MRRSSLIAAMMFALAAPAFSAGPASRALEQWQHDFGTERYRYDADHELRLLFATSIDKASFQTMREMLNRQAAYLIDRLFQQPPDYEVLVVIPLPEDARAYLPQPNAPGIYEHRHRRLIARDIGYALRHEFVHVLHFGHMERLQQRHPIWIQEGLAALFEHYEWRGDGSIRFLPNERNRVIRARVRAGQALPWRNLFDLSGERFMVRATALYPQARSMFEYLAHEGKLEAWYHAYVEHFDEDPGGAKAFELAFGKPIRQIERDWRRWVFNQPEHDDTIAAGDPSLGIETEADVSSSGILIRRFTPDSAARAAGLQLGDVILSANGEATATIDELRRVLRGRRVGDAVRIRVLRGGHYHEITVHLKPLRVR